MVSVSECQYRVQDNGSSSSHCMASHRLCLRFTFFSLVAVAAVSVILVVYQGSLEQPMHVLDSWYRFPGFLDRNSSANVSYLPVQTICNKKAMSNTLLVIVFLDSSYEEIPLLEELYRKHFPNILYCGPVEAQTGSVQELLVIDVEHGITAYGCMAGAIKAHPKYKGYLFMRSNVFVNYWRLAELDRSRIWQSPTLGSQAMFEQSRDPWIWWYTPWGLKACEKAYKQMIFLNAVNKQKISKYKDNTLEILWDIENSLNALLWNGRGTYKCYRGNANIFYIPRKYATAFQKMAEIFGDFRVFMNIAVSTMIQMLELRDKVVRLDGIDIGEIHGEDRAMKDKNLFWQHLNYTAPYIRPLGIKFNSKGTTSYKELVQTLLDRLYNDEECLDEDNVVAKDTLFGSFF